MRSSMKRILLFFISFLILTNFGLSQILPNLEADEIYGIGTILLIIAMILIAAGFTFRARIPTGIIIFALIVIFLVILPYFVPKEFVVPENWKIAKLPEWLSKILVFMGIPEAWTSVPAFIYLFIIPFVGIFAVVFGFLEQIKIFESRINKVLALLFSLSILPIGLFARMVYFYFAISAFFGIATFIVIFILGIVFLGMKKTGVVYYEVEAVSRLEKILSEMWKRYHELSERRARATTSEERTRLGEELNRLVEAIRATEEQKRKIVTGT